MSLAGVVFCLVSMLAVTSTTGCRDQYKTCPGWSGAGYCQKPDYRAYMELMCAYSCNTCDVITEENTSAENSASGSGERDENQATEAANQETPVVKPSEELQQAEPNEERKSEQDNEKPENEATEQPQETQVSESATDDASSSGDDNESSSSLENVQSSAPSDADSDSQEKDIQEGEPRLHGEPVTGQVQPQAPEPEGSASSGTNIYASGSPPKPGNVLGVRDIVLHADYDDDVNPRSQIANPAVQVVPQQTDDSQNQNEAVTLSSGSSEDSGDGPSSGSQDQDVPSKRPEITLPKQNTDRRAHVQDETTSGSADQVGSANHDEMSDIKGDVTSGSRIFEETTVEPENASGCSSGYGCFSGNGEQIKSNQGQENMDLESRSNIDKPPKEEHEALMSGTGEMDNSTSSSEFEASESENSKKKERTMAGFDFKDINRSSTNLKFKDIDSISHPSDHRGSIDGEDEDQDEATSFSVNDNSNSEAEHEGNEMEDALFEGVSSAVAKSGSGIDSGSGEAKAEPMKDLSSTKAKHRITLMEKMMNEGLLKAMKVSHVNANTRGEVPHTNDEEKIKEDVDTDIGKGEDVSFILNQDFHKEYTEQDSMAYEILAQSVKKEVETAVGNEARVSEINFSEAKQPGKTPNFSRVLVKIKLLGDKVVLENAVHEGRIKAMVVDKTFFETS